MDRVVTRISVTIKWYLPNTKFTTNTEENAALPFLDIPVTTTFDGMVRNAVHKKTTNIDL